MGTARILRRYWSPLLASLTVWSCLLLLLMMLMIHYLVPTCDAFLPRVSTFDTVGRRAGTSVAVHDFTGLDSPFFLAEAAAAAAEGKSSSFYSLLATAAPTVIVGGTAEPYIPSVWDGMVHSPVFWSSTVMVTIVGLLYLWDMLVERAREETPKEVRPVIERILGEMGSLGFIGVVLSVLLNRSALGDAVERLSGEYLGGREILMETFEFLHEAFFQVGMTFFATAGFIVFKVIRTLDQITAVAEQGLAVNDGDNVLANDDGDGIDEEEVECMATAENLARILEVYTLPAGYETEYNDDDGTVKSETVCTMKDYEATMVIRKNMAKPPLIRELTMSMEQRGAECLTIRERLIRELDLPQTFSISRYLSNVFADNKLDVVELSPLSWLPLIPALALANALDLAHDVVNVDSPNAAETSGYFFSTPWVWFPTLTEQSLCLGWGLLNFQKMASIKSMLMPTLVRDAGQDGKIRLVPPAVENDLLRAEFDSTPAIVRPLEQYFRAPPGTINAELFGDVGANGPEFYLNSIKFHTWFTVTSLFFITSEILPRDVYALLHSPSVEVGDPTNLLPELAAYGALAIMDVMILSQTPITFLNYCLITSVEDLKREWAIERAIDGWDGSPIRKPDVPSRKTVLLDGAPVEAAS